MPPSHRPEGRIHLPSEVDYVRTLVGYADLFGKQPTWRDFFNRLGAVSLEPLMHTLSYLNSVLHVRGVLNSLWLNPLRSRRRWQ